MRRAFGLDHVRLERLRVARAVVDVERQIGLVQGIDGFVEELHRRLEIRRALEDAERGALQNALVVGEGDLGAFLRDRADAAVPGHLHVDLAVVEQLRRLRA